MKKILLITLDYDKTVTSNLVSLVSQVVRLPFLSMKAFMAPVGMATVAALTPDDIDIDMWDEAVHGKITEDTNFEKAYDLVAITGYTSHFNRMTQLGQLFRQRGIPVAVGGPGVSASPELYRDVFDILFIGEAEFTWPQFMDDWKAGRQRSEYRQVGAVDMAHSPPPRWDKVAADLKSYMVAGVQTTRGCPFDCEFCDVIYLYGRQQRHKSIDQVLQEISTLDRLGVERVFFADDNFYGTPRYYKALLKELIPLNQSFRCPLTFHTQIDLRVAKDYEMLGLLADANFGTLFIGIETPNVESLVEANKIQNYKTDILEDVKKIHSYGLQILAGMIVGFDHDDTTIFQSQFQFLQEACIPTPTINILSAMEGTKLWIRLLKEGRVLESPAADRSFPYFANFSPRRMTRVELLSGYLDLVEKVRNWRNFEARVKGMVSRVQRRPQAKTRVARNRNWKQIAGALKFVLFQMDREVRGVTCRLLFYTVRQAPFMLGRVAWAIVSQYMLAAQLPNIRESITALLHLEAEGGVRWQPKKPAFLVPDAFKKTYKAIFPELHERIYQGLVEKSRTHDALVEVTYDFLTRWGPTFQGFEEHHRVFLHEICDRTIAKENRAFAGEEASISAQRLGDVNPSAAVGEAPDIRRTRLADAVLHAVEQELRSVQRPV